MDGLCRECGFGAGEGHSPTCSSKLPDPDYLEAVGNQYFTFIKPGIDYRLRRISSRLRDLEAVADATRSFLRTHETNLHHLRMAQEIDALDGTYEL